MTKLCPRGKAAAKRKFRVYPSAYANAYASKICAGKIKDPSGVKRKDFRGRKPAAAGGEIKESNKNDKKTNSIELIKKRKDSKKEALEKMKKELGLKAGGIAENVMGLKIKEKRDFRKPSGKKALPLIERKSPPRIPSKKRVPRSKAAGGGLMEATQRLRREGLKKGGRGCKLAMKGRGRAYGKNS